MCITFLPLDVCDKQTAISRTCLKNFECNVSSIYFNICLIPPISLNCSTVVGLSQANRRIKSAFA